MKLEKIKESWERSNKGKEETLRSSSTPKDLQEEEQAAITKVDPFFNFLVLYFPVFRILVLMFLYVCVLWSLVSYCLCLKVMNVLWIHTFLKWKMFLIEKEKNCMNFEFYNRLIILMWWQYFWFLNVCLNSAYVFWSCCSWMLNMLALERMMTRRHFIL